MSPEDQNEEEREERGPKSYWWLALSVMFLFLAGGGYYALTSMKGEAHKLVGGEKYEQYSASAGAPSGALQKADNYFASDEADPAAEKAAREATAAAAKLNTVAAAKPAPGRAGGGASGSYAGGQGGLADEAADQAQAPSAQAPRGGLFEGKLQARASGLGGAGSAAAKTQAAAGGGSEPYQPGGTASARPSVQRETAGGKPQKGEKSGVLDSLKGAFRASFYGARIASQDAAKDWIARSFDAVPGSSLSLEYDEKMKKDLDRVDPNSIPKFLRDQDITNAEAKTLQTKDVGDPAIDKEGTKEALKNDKDYQQKKAAGELANSMINPLFSGAGKLAGGNTGRSESDTPGGDERASAPLPSPEDEAVLRDIGLNDYISTEGYGAECGCTQQAPCCCLPQNTATGNCPLYGPFLPTDPCGASIYGSSSSPLPTGDFPASSSTMKPA